MLHYLTEQCAEAHNLTMSDQKAPSPVYLTLPRKGRLGPRESHDADHARVGHGIDGLGVVALAKIVLDHCGGVEIM